MSPSPLPSYRQPLFCLHPPPSPSLPPGSCLTRLPAPASWATPGGCHGPAECWTPSEVAEPWAPTPFPLLSGAFGGDLKEGREAGRGRQPWSLGSKCCFWWHWRWESGQSRWEPRRGRGKRGWGGGVESDRGGEGSVCFPSRSIHKGGAKGPRRLGHCSVGGTYWAVCQV